MRYFLCRALVSQASAEALSTPFICRYGKGSRLYDRKPEFFCLVVPLYDAVYYGLAIPCYGHTLLYRAHLVFGVATD